MKRFMCAAALAVLLTGCSNTQNNNNNSIESNPITWNLGEDLEIISSKEYVNLNFGSCPEAQLPSLTECYNIKAYYIGNSELINAQKIEKFEEYCVYYFGECDPEYALFEPQEYGSVPHEDLEINAALLNPAWKFTLLNSNDGWFYNVYIDAVSGECSYYSYSPL